LRETRLQISRETCEPRRLSHPPFRLAVERRKLEKLFEDPGVLNGGAFFIRSGILWEDHHVDVTASEAMAATKSPAARDEAKKFLTDILASGPVLRTEIEEAAKANGIAERTLYRAKSELSITAEKKGQNCQWQWRSSERDKSHSSSN
jgi:hypothetical protein